MTQALPTRVQAELNAADALMAQDQAARAAAPPVATIADLTKPPVPQAQTPVPPPTAPTPPAAPPAESFEQKYKSLQGKYNAEVPALARKAAEQDRVIAEMSAQLRTLTETKAAPTTPPVSDAQDIKDIKDFGPDLCEMVARVTSKKIAEAMAALEPRLAQLGGQVTTVTQQAAVSAETQFYQLLSKLMPDWEQINGQEAWLKWLGVIDPVYGVRRQAGLDDAFAKLDAERVATVFSTFKASIPPAPTPETLQNQQVPDTSGGSPPPAPDAKPILSQQAVQAFYRDQSRGVYAGREAEAAAIEAQIDIAVAEGRVR